MSPSTLSLFPAPSTSFPSKITSRRPRNDQIASDNAEVSFRGVAFHVVTSPHKTAQVQPATDTIKHTLFCDPPVSQSVSIQPDVDSTVVSGTTSPSSRSSLPRRQSRTRRKSGPLTMDFPPSIDHSVGTREEEDSLSDLPSNTNFSASTPPRRAGSTQKRTENQHNSSAQAHQRHFDTTQTSFDEKKDCPSLLPEKNSHHFSSSANNAYPSARRTFSPVPANPPQDSESYYTTPMRSMFPIYDPSKPFDRQNYYPTLSASPPPAYLGDNVSKLGSPAERQHFQRFDSAVGLLDRYEHIPTAAHSDMQALWNASCDELPVVGSRKAQFGLFQPSSNGKSLAIGTSSEDLFYIMEKDTAQAPVASKQFAVRKHCPTARSSYPVSTLVLPDAISGKAASKSSSKDVTIFPHAAAMDAIENVLRTPEESHASTFSPAAQSPEATTLAQGAITEAHRRYCCDLIKRTRKRDSLGAVTAYYDLQHPTLGRCPVTVTKSTSAGSITGPRAKISFHHPSATPAAVAADTLNLAFIDFAHDACVLDIPGILALDCHYIVDTVVSALLAVAVIENDALVAETLVFEAPPKTPLQNKARKTKRGGATSSVGSRKSIFKRSSSAKEDVDAKLETKVFAADEQVELGGVAKGLLAVMELTFKASAWVIVTGAKVGFGVVEYGIEKVQNRI